MHAQIKTRVPSGGVGAAANLDDESTWKPGSLAQLVGVLKGLDIEGISADDAEHGAGIRIVMANHDQHAEAKRRLSDNQLAGDDGHAVVVSMVNESDELSKRLSKLAEWGYLVDGIAVLASHTAEGLVRVSIGTTRALSREHRREIGAEADESEEPAEAA